MKSIGNGMKSKGNGRGWRQRRAEKRSAKRLRYVERQAAKGDALRTGRDASTGSYGHPPDLGN
jgi:hypothetical protein